MSCITGHWSLPNHSIVYDYLKIFGLGYAKAHVYLALGLCTFGIIANVLNLIVLAQKSMRNAINAILAAVALCDIMVMLSLTIFVFHTRLFPPEQCQPESKTLFWAVFEMMHGHVSMLLHTGSLWLTILLALVRFISLRKSGTGNSRYLSWKSGWIDSVIVLAVTGILCLPMFSCFRIDRWQLHQDPFCLKILNSTNPKLYRTTRYLERSNRTDEIKYLYRTGYRSFALENNCMMIKVLFWLTGLLYKMLPCIILGILVAMLVKILQDAKQRQLKLQVRNGRPSADRTTAMLLVVVAIFLITELPQGLLAMCVPLFGTNFKINIYANLGDFVDLLSLINSCANFIIYCSMSSAYRKAFVQLFVPNFVPVVPRIPNPLSSFMQSRANMPKKEKSFSEVQHHHLSTSSDNSEEYFL